MNWREEWRDTEPGLAAGGVGFSWRVEAKTYVIGEEFVLSYQSLCEGSRPMRLLPVEEAAPSPPPQWPPCVLPLWQCLFSPPPSDRPSNRSTTSNSPNLLLSPPLYPCPCVLASGVPLSSSVSSLNMHQAMAPNNPTVVAFFMLSLVAISVVKQPRGNKAKRTRLESDKQRPVAPIIPPPPQALWL